MAEKVEKKSVFVGGGNGQPVGAHSSEVDRAKDIARRYRCEFVDLHDFQLHHDLFTKIPPRLMFSYNFVPLEETHDGRLAIAIADPSQLMMIDEISLLLGKRIITKVATLAQITEILGRNRISLSAVNQRESHDGGHVPVVITTHNALEGNMRIALREIDTELRRGSLQR